MSPDALWTARDLPRRAMSATGARQAELRHAARVSVAVGAAFAVSTLLNLPQGYWAVFTAVIVVQTSIGGTITASLERMAGTVVGGLVGVAGAYLRASTILEEGLVLSAAVALLAFAAAVQPKLKVAPITAAIVLVGGGATHMSPMLAAFWRVAEILLGSVVGLAATLFVFPARARKAVAERLRGATAALADILDIHARDLSGPEAGEDIRRAHKASRKQLAGVEQAIAEAARENASGLGDARVSDALLQTLLRVRSDTAMVGRALASPLPPTVAAPLAPPAQALLTAIALQLRRCCDAPGHIAAPAHKALNPQRAAFEHAVEQVRRAKLTTDMTFDAVARVFGLVFALESLMFDLDELVERASELEPAPESQAEPAPSG